MKTITLTELMDLIAEKREAIQRTLLVLTNLIYSESKHANNQKEFNEQLNKLIGLGDHIVDLRAALDFRVRDVTIDYEDSPYGEDTDLTLEEVYVLRDKINDIVLWLGNVGQALDSFTNEDKVEKYLAIDLEEVERKYTTDFQEQYDIWANLIDKTMDKTTIELDDKYFE